MFCSRLQLEDRPQPDTWMVAAPLIWQGPVNDRLVKLVVPAGFVTDLASIPRLFRNLPWLDPNGISRRPAVVHDWLYGSLEGRRFGKEFADCFLGDALIAEGASLTVASTFHLAVHWFGRSSWNDDGRRLSAPNPAP